MNDDTKGMLFGLIGAFSFSLTLPFTRSIIDVFDPLFIAMGRVFVATFIAAGWLILTRQPLPNLHQCLQLLVVAMGIVFGFPIFTALGMKTLPASHGGVVLGLLPLATTFFGVIIYRERPSIGFWLACLAGSSLVVGYSLLQSGGHLQIGDLSLLVAVFTVSLGYAVGASLSRQMGGLNVVSWALILSFPIVIFPAIYTMPSDLDVIPLKQWLSFLYLAAVSQWLGFLFWYKGLAIGGIARVSQTQLLQPFMVIFAAWLIAGEAFNLVTLVFACSVILIVSFGKQMAIRQS